MAGDAGGGTGNPEEAAREAGGRGPVAGNQDGGGVGCSVYFERIAGVEAKIAMERAARGESGDWWRGGVPVSGDGRNRASACGRAAAISVCAGVIEFSGDTGAGRGVEKIEANAGFAVLRWPGVCASAADGAREPPGDFAGPADDWVREEHFDWDA